MYGVNPDSPDSVSSRLSQASVECIAKVKFPTEYGEFTLYSYEALENNIVHLAVVKGDVREKADVLVRVHSECLTGDAFGSMRCDCGVQLDSALRQIAEAGCGVVVYLRGHEGRGIGLKEKMRAYQLQDVGYDTVEANLSLGWPVDLRDYTVGAKIIVHLGIKRIRLLTNNPAKLAGLGGQGFEIIETLPLVSKIHQENKAYLMAKKNKLGHLFDLGGSL